MTIRFTCGACRAVLKVPEVVTEERKVRCTSCGIVILLTPDEASPTGMTASLPDTSKKEKARAQAEAARQRRILIAALLIVIIILGGGLWWTFSGPADRASVEGFVKLDDVPLESGTILFILHDDPKKTSAKGTIEKGSYKLTGSSGPYLGKNKVEIHATRVIGDPLDEKKVESVASEYNSKTKLETMINAVNNKADFKVRSK